MIHTGTTQAPQTFTLNISEDISLPVYRHLYPTADNFDIDFLYGGRDSGKSREIAQILVRQCLTLPYFRCILVRKVANTIKESQWQLIKDVVEEWGLDQFFQFNSSPLEIKCKNGNRFYCRGMDEPARLKSVSNPSHCWVEEGNQIDNTDFVTILTTLRYNEGNTKVWFSFNPECDVSYTEFWLYQEYFSHTSALSFEHIKEIKTPDGELITYRTRATHSTYRNNPYCSAQRKALYESYKYSKNNQYWYQTYTLGLWGYRRSGGAFWKSFDEVKNLGDVEISPKLPFHLVVDNNVYPYITQTLWQIDGKQFNQVDEIMCESPDNTATKSATKAAEWLKKRGQTHVFLYGDPSANAKSTIDDSGRSFFDKYIASLREAGIHVTNRVGRKAPDVARSAEFINDIYENNLHGCSIVIGHNCTKSKEDYLMVKEDANGAMLKKRETHPDTKVSYERYGHASDCKRYFITQVLHTEFQNYKKRRKKRIISVPQ